MTETIAIKATKSESTKTFEKTINDILNDYRNLDKERIQLFEGKRLIELKIKETEDETQKLNKHLEKIESILSNSANLIMSGEMTSAGFSKLRQDQFCIHGGIDDQETIKELCLAKLSGWSDSWRELRGRMQNTERELRHAKMKNLASEIVDKCGSELKMLIALVGLLDNYHLTRSKRDDDYQNLGALICCAIYGGGIRNTETPGYPQPDETAALLQKFSEEIGILS